MKKHCYIFLLASVLILANQSVHGNKYIYTSPRVYNLERYILSADTIKQKAQIEDDQKELALRHEGKIWKAKAVRLWNWAKRNPGKATICGLATAAAIGGLGYLAWNHWHLPAKQPQATSLAVYKPLTPTVTSSTEPLCSLQSLSPTPVQQAQATAVAIYNQAPRPVTPAIAPSTEPLCPLQNLTITPVQQAQVNAVAIYNPAPRPATQAIAPSTEPLCPLQSLISTTKQQQQTTALAVYNKHPRPYAPYSTTSTSPKPELQSIVPADFTWLLSYLRTRYNQLLFLRHISLTFLNGTK